ncbi:MAG: hypothetical protein M1596_03210 [Firmicutes bacterium]|nr:hypothetical protein [Bacillota bacterium]
MTSSNPQWPFAVALCVEIAGHPLHPSFDCTEVVEVFFRTCSTGKMRYVCNTGATPVFFEIWEHRHWVRYVYHAVFELDGYVFDPYWSATPMRAEDYLARLQDHNPSVPLHWCDELPATYPQ